MHGAATPGGWAHRSRCPHPPGRPRAERGAATAEVVVVLPLLVVTTLALVWLLSLAAAQTRAVDAAREVARALARDEPQAEALALGRRVAPADARFSVTTDSGAVVVVVRARVRGPGGIMRFTPGVSVRAEAVAALEAP